jgi:hypothetical protein
MSDELMQEPSTYFAQRAAATVFPGRLRLFCDERVAHLLSPTERADSVVQGAKDGYLFGAACGAAVIEHQRQGYVVVLLPARALQDEQVRQAAKLALGLALNNLTLIIVGNELSDSDWLIDLGWSRGGEGEGLVVRHVQPPTTSYVVAPARMREEHQPVHLSTLLPGDLPPWPVDDLSVPLASVVDWMSWLISREPHLVVADMAQPWRTLPPSPALLAALAQVSCEGRRVCWRLPTATNLFHYLAAMHEIGRRGQALKLMVTTNDLPNRPQLAALTGWWVLVPNDVAEAAAMFAFALAIEDPVLLALPSTAINALPSWPVGQAYIPGTGRWFCHGAQATIVCDYRTLQTAVQAAATLSHDNIQVGVLICSTLVPLPVGDLDHIPPAPIIACGNDLGVAWSSALIDRDWSVSTQADGLHVSGLIELVKAKRRR